MELGVSVGSDPRISGPAMEAALVAGLVAGGSHVTTFGIATTPCMFHSIVSPEAGFRGAIMITASHMPYNANGLKFFVEQGGLDKPDISDVLQRAAALAANAGITMDDPLATQAHLLQAAMQADCSRVRQLPFLSNYAAHLRSLIVDGVRHPETPQFPLLGLKIVVDAGNGSGGFFAEQVLAPLGADTTGSQFLDPDGTFPNHVPNPEHPSAMAAGRFFLGFRVLYRWRWGCGG